MTPSDARAVPPGSTCATQNKTACQNLYYINCMYNTTTSTCSPVKASYCASLPINTICAANWTCFWNNTACADCSSYPCLSTGPSTSHFERTQSKIAAVDCDTGNFTQSSCSAFANNCKWTQPLIANTSAFCTNKTCSDFNSTFCAASKCSSVGADTTKDFVCYTTGSSLPVAPHLSCLNEPCRARMHFIS